MASTSHRLLQLAIPLIPIHGFTRAALSRSVLSLGNSHSEPLSDPAVSSLFGSADDARRRLINAWLDHTIVEMRSSRGRTMKEVLIARLNANEPVLQYLPEAFAILASPTSGIPPLDPRPAMKHAAKIADEACYLTNDPATELSWYSRRASLAAIYAAAELHQLTSPKTANEFLGSLLDTSSVIKRSLDETELFATYIFKSWAGIIKSSGVL